MNYYILYFSLYVGAFLLSVMGLWFTVIVTQLCGNGATPYTFFPKSVLKLRDRPGANGNYIDREYLCRCCSTL